eukprot:CAMPEP_0174256312 /NCGR_PEP_ID=MMETSP0439-20130205/5562_1 /TAXON_ID=0 /ORGANISM="Stereomyxa ramosa, Strain Chinc5" /LENGTH=220 /DNA_ID=CAMNT_0015338863 /DNA_START=460 /DNA_END=1118 /DNA_ORIENTATION=+
MVFFMGSFADLTTSILETWFLEYEKLAYYSDIVAASTWLVSGMFGFLDLIFTYRRRKKYNHQYQYTLLPWHNWSQKGSVTYIFYWQGIADFFFIPGALLYLAGSYICWYCSYDACYLIQTLAGLFYLLDSVLFFMGIHQESRCPKITNWADVQPLIGSTSESSSQSSSESSSDESDGYKSEDFRLHEFSVVGCVNPPGRLDSPIPPFRGVPFSVNTSIQS